MQLLGPVATCDRAGVRALAGRSATIVAVLVSARPAWIQWDVLAEEAWTGDTPTRGTVHTAISRCRSALRPGLSASLESGPLGYRLALRGGESDLDEFVTLVRQIEAAKSEGCTERLLTLAERAVELWSDRAFSNVLDSHRVAAYASSLERMRWDVIDAGATAALSAGLGHRWRAPLEQVLEAEPLRQTSTILLAECENRAGNQAAAMRVLCGLRRRLHAVGLVATTEVVDAENRLLIDEPVRPRHPHAQRSFALASLSFAQQHLRFHRYGPALLEAERVISQQTRLSGDETAEAWMVVARASDALVRPVAFRHALVETVKSAIGADATHTLHRALALSARATAPGEQNQGLVDVLRTATLHGEDEVWAAGAIAVNSASGTVAAAAWRTLEIAAGVVCSPDHHHAGALSAFAAECWLRLTEGQPEVEKQRMLADRLVEMTQPHTVSFSVAVAQRASRALRAGDLQAYEHDISAIEKSASSMGMIEDQAISMQMRAALLMAQGDLAEASTMIDGAAELVLDHPVHQEVAAIQRWWLCLDENPTRYLDDLRAVAEFGRSPSYTAILAYTLLRCGDAEGARVALESAFVDDRLSIEPDPSYPTALAGLAAVAVWIDARDRLEELNRRLTPYSGQILVAPGHAFVLGAADRFLGQLAIACGRRREGVAALDRASEIEHRMCFALPRAATMTVARTLGVSLGG